MLELRVLGALDLRDEAGREIDRVLAQPKRLALFAYLALTDVAQQRESLLALFWPELDAEHARLALRQAVHFLRESLGPKAISSRTSEELGLAPGALRCDAREFERALDEGRVVQALDLYRGDLLPGFHVADIAPEFEQWLDRERQRVRARAARAAWALAEAAEREANGVEAAHRARQAAQFAPDDETGFRRLVSLLDRLGDRKGALRAYDEFARRLRSEFEVEPAAETRALVEAVRSREKVVSTPPGLSTPPEASPAPSIPPGPAAAPTASTTPRTSKWRIAAVALAGAVVLGGGIAALLARRVTSTPPRTIAVGFIQNQGGDSTADAARILPGLLATSLARVSGLSVVSESRIYELLEQIGSESPTRRSFTDAARRAGADELIEGVLYRRARGGLRLDLRRVDAARGTVRSTYSAEGVDAFEVADRVTARVAEGFALTAPGTSLAEAASGSVIARRFYEEGLRAYYRGEWRAAFRLFASALSEDSTFAMAAYYAALSVAPYRTDSLFILMVRAHRLADRAPERDRLIIKYARYSEYSVKAAIAESLALRFPNEPDGPLAMAGVRLVAGDFSGAVSYARRAIAMDSLSLQGEMPACRACVAFGTLLAAYKGMGSDSFPAIERVAREWIRLQPKVAGAWLMLAEALSWRGRSDQALEALNKATLLQPSRSQFYERPETVPAILFMSAVIQGENYPVAERLLRDRSRFDERDQEANWWLVTSLRHQGHISESLSLAAQTKHFRIAEGRTPDPWEYVEATLLFELGRFRESARKFEALMQARPNDPSDPGYTSRYGVQAATAWAAAGDTQRLPALADSIERAARHSSYGLDWHLPHHVRGLLWQARGQPARAVEEFQAAIYSPTLGYTRTNLELARTFLALGRPHDAIRILREALAGSSDGPDYFLTRTEVHEWLARGFDAAGRRDSAVVHYRKVAEAWKNGDAPYRARAEAARRKLHMLAQ
jgi:DNA-binding SARP family transcriptional activator/tetratricopeptide (TPR) repeat protein